MDFEDAPEYEAPREKKIHRMMSPADFHELARQEAHQQALDRMVNVAERGKRMMNPSFRGIPTNPAAGAQLQLFHSHRDESHVVLPMRTVHGGALATAEGQAYAKKLLERRARDVEAIQNADATLPIEALPFFYDTDTVLQQFNLNQYLSSVGDVIQSGEFNGETLQLLHQALGALMVLVPRLDQDAIVEIYQYLESLLEQINGLLAAKEDLGPRVDRILQSVGRTLEDARRVLQTFTREGIPEKSKKKILRDLLRNMKLKKLDIAAADTIIKPEVAARSAEMGVNSMMSQTETVKSPSRPPALVSPLLPQMVKPPRRAPPGTPLSTRRFPLSASAAENPEGVNVTTAEVAEQDTTAGPLNLTALQTPMVRRDTTGGYRDEEEDETGNQSEERAELADANMDPRAFRVLLASGVNPVEAFTQHQMFATSFLEDVREIFKSSADKENKSKALAGAIGEFFSSVRLPDEIPVYNERAKNVSHFIDILRRSHL